MQPALTDAAPAADYKTEIDTPDALDLLVTSRNAERC